MSVTYKEEPFEYPPEKKGGESNMSVGEAWKAYPTETGYVVTYISGELAGRSKELRITREEFQQLEGGKISFDSLLIKYGCN